MVLLLCFNVHLKQLEVGMMMIFGYRSINATSHKIALILFYGVSASVTSTIRFLALCITVSFVFLPALFL